MSFCSRDAIGLGVLQALHDSCARDTINCGGSAASVLKLIALISPVILVYSDGLHESRKTSRCLAGTQGSATQICRGENTYPEEGGAETTGTKEGTPKPTPPAK
ncbi:hypothetical protein MUK42_10765 [Musa troglodytarum]|uniref:Uncharacterized protein n=1 Tax=Musa troglodytarum TaxID=320322 RepID=A0A9E7H0C6_9LILI|nr:hypothetical protein MUK42_10765 [Musa troglodytarum]